MYSTYKLLERYLEGAMDDGNFISFNGILKKGLRGI